jgi:hypothetical protein
MEGNDLWLPELVQRKIKELMARACYTNKLHNFNVHYTSYIEPSRAHKYARWKFCRQDVSESWYNARGYRRRKYAQKFLLLSHLTRFK